MALINNCRGMAIVLVQCREAPNDAWRNLESYYRATGTREILLLSNEVNGKTTQLGENLIQFMMEIDRLAADLHRLGDRSVTDLRKFVVIVTGLSADYEIEVRMLENNPAGLGRTEIECVIGNQYNRLLRQRHDSKALSSSKGTTTEDRGEKKRRPHNRFEGN